MATKVRLEMDSAAFRAILSSSEVAGMLRGKAEAIANAAGPGHEVTVIQGGYGGGRAIAFVTTDTFEAMLSEATDRTLSSALDAGR